MSFNEENTVERFVRDLLSPIWAYVDSDDLGRTEADLFVLDRLKAALILLNPEIAAQPDRAEDVLHRLRAIVLGVRTDGLVKANEEFATWLNGERSMPFGPGGEHVTVRLVDFDDLTNNDFLVTTQFRFQVGEETRIPDLVLLVNGMPLVVIEAKTPTRACVSWVDGALQVHGYE
ncbi:MAG: type I restriction endonuclease subunit R, partial [Gemmatimonadales bacterium]|nr:type I restriction endonuclease subunit R [Gemmatimonadales bacterium]